MSKITDTNNAPDSGSAEPSGSLEGLEAMWKHMEDMQKFILINHGRLGRAFTAQVICELRQFMQPAFTVIHTARNAANRSRENAISAASGKPHNQQ